MRPRLKLGVNIDHVATLRQARGEDFPNVIQAARQAIAGGADSIVAHLREDRRHIQDKDIRSIRKAIRHFDMEMAATPEMLNIALKVKPDMATIVPEKREELTTEGGLDVAGNLKKLKPFVNKLEKNGIRVSLFIDPQPAQIRAGALTGASFIEIHTGTYASSGSSAELNKIKRAVKLALSVGLKVNAGHGLDYGNVSAIARIPGIAELNIGFSIIARAVFTGIKNATSDMKKLLFLILAILTVASACSGVVVSTPEAVVQKPLFRDIPEGHWAASSVNTIVGLGVTQGYPDGTYRGEKYMTRYEMAIFLAKVNNAIETKKAVNEKLIAELRSEVYKLHYSLVAFRDQPKKRGPVYGLILARLRSANVVKSDVSSKTKGVSSGPVFDYRLTADYRRGFGEDSFIRVGIDTMDSSLVGGRDLFTEMFEAEGAFYTDSGFGVSVTAGPGLIVHKEGPNNIIPSEDNTVFLRPNNGVKFTYDNGDYDIGTGFMATSVSTGGATETNDIYGYVNYTFHDTFLGEIESRYAIDRFANDLAANHSSREATINMLEFVVMPAAHIRARLKYGVEGSDDAPHNSFVGLNLYSDEFMSEGCTAGLYYSKIGSSFLAAPSYPAILGANIFSKLFIEGSCDYALVISKQLSSEMTLRLLSDIVTGPNGEYGEKEPNASSTYELGLDYGVFENAAILFAYRVFQHPSAAVNANSDVLGIGFRYIY